jgi:hypothetical protein
MEISPSDSWMNVSDRLTHALGLPIGTLFRIFPTVGDVENQDPDDGSYSITWEENKQYWYDIIYDEARDRRGAAKEIRMVDYSGRVDTLVVPNAANAAEIMEIWRRVLEVPDGIDTEVRSGNGIEYFWGYRTAAETFPTTLRSHNMHADIQIFPGANTFKADQICRLLDIKVPPFDLCQVTAKNDGGEIFEFDGETPQLNLRILKEHTFSWNLEGVILSAPMPMSCWLPYDFNVIMRYGPP